MKTTEGYLMKEIAGEYVLVPFGKRAEQMNRLISLSDTAAFMYQHISEAADPEEMVRLVSQEYDIDAGEIRRDIREALISMEQQGLIQIEE